MTVTVYRSSDGSAPTLTGAANSLVNLFGKCLVDGYGSQTGAGWTRGYADSGNKGCFRNSAVDGTGYYLLIDDSGPGAGTYKEARATGAVTATSVSTGTGYFPTSSQVAIGAIGAVVIRKSTTADATTRAWTLIADDTVFYFFAETGDVATTAVAYGFVFGDIFSLKTADANRCIIIGRNLENSAAGSQDGFAALANVAPSTTPLYALTMPGHYMAASWTGSGGSAPVGKTIDAQKLGANLGACANASVTGTTAMAQASACAMLGANYAVTNVGLVYPNGPDGGMYLSPIWIHHNGSLRGYLKGLWCPCHHLPLSHNDTFSGAGNMSGKSFLMQWVQGFSASANATGSVAIETSTTWS